MRFAIVPHGAKFFQLRTGTLREDLGFANYYYCMLCYEFRFLVSSVLQLFVRQAARSFVLSQDSRQPFSHYSGFFCQWTHNTPAVVRVLLIILRSSTKLYLVSPLQQYCSSSIACCIQKMHVSSFWRNDLVRLSCGLGLPRTSIYFVPRYDMSALSSSRVLCISIS